MSPSSIIRKGVDLGLGRVRRILPGRPVVAPFDLVELCYFLLEELERFSGHRDLALILPDSEAGDFRVLASRGYHDRDLSLVRFARNASLVRHFSLHPVSIHYSALEKTPWFRLLGSQEEEGLAALMDSLILPLATARTLVGLLVVGHVNPVAHPRWGYLDPAVRRTRMASIIEEAQIFHQLKLQGQVSPQHREYPTRGEYIEKLSKTAVGIAHDLKNTLAVIVTRSHLIEDGDNIAEAHQHTLAIRQAAMYGAESLRGIDDPAVSEADIQARSVDVNEIIRSTLSAMEPEWRQGRISPMSPTGHLRHPYGSPGPPTDSAGAHGLYGNLAVTLCPAGRVLASAAEMRRALTNLIANAIDAIPTDGGRIEISSGNDGGWATIGIKDNGPGLSPEIQDRIFDPFFTTKGQEGRGLGLGISRDIISNYGGRLEVSSEEGCGSTFTISLPLA